MRMKLRMKKMLSMLLCVLMAFAMSAAAFAEGADQTIDLSGHIVILHTNDSHGRADTNLGFTRVAVAKERLEEAGAIVLLLDAGDTLHGLPFATLDKGESIVKIMNAVGYDAMVPGSRDFNYGAARLSESEDITFALLAANIKNEDGTPLLSESVVIEKGNVKFGIFGLVSPEIASQTNPDNVAGLTFTDPVEAAREQVAALEAEKCTVIIALTHIGLDESAEITGKMIAEQVEGIDIIVDGGSHTLLEEGLWVNNTLIVSAGEYIENIGCVDIDSEGNAAATQLTSEDFGEADVDAEIDALIADITAGQNELLDDVIGQTTVELEGAHEKVCTAETNLGNLAADAVRNATGADIALVTGGEIKASVPAGDITKEQILTVFTSDACAAALNVTGEQLLAILENGVGSYPQADDRFPQISGMSFKFDDKQEAGSRVFDVKVGEEALDPAKTYVLATNDYALVDAPLLCEYSTMEEVLVAYIASLEGPAASEAEGRIVMEAKSAE